MNEPFLDLPIDIDENASLNYCLEKFSHKEILKDSEKFFCDKCKSLQVAEKKIILKKLPKTLIIHLKRFKYDEKFKRLMKLNWKIAFPLEIRINCVIIEKKL